ncbi:MAG: hypothetical protein E7463_09485 [Ruminococcaceae bacterium]|nr:hypothetical protein [Oscillospiraceae bacterium]
MKYEQLTPGEALESYCDWLLTQQTQDEVGTFFYIKGASGMRSREWYMIFYPLRTLLLAGKLLNRPDYTEAVWKYFDNYVGEQLPNGAFSSNYRRQPSETLTKKDIQELLRSGKLNLADNGTNTHALIQAAMMCDDPVRKERYLKAVGHWLDDWVSIWALPNGSYGNGIWGGHKLNGPYTIALNAATSMSAYTLATGDYDYVENAENFIRWQAGHWLEDGRPIRFNCYPEPEAGTFIDDFSRIFYVMESMCWIHYASKNEEVRKLIEEKLKAWIFGSCGILTQFPSNALWFQQTSLPGPDGLVSSRREARTMWEYAKCTAIPSLFSYYLNNIEENAQLRETYEKAIRFLSNPLHAVTIGVAGDPNAPMGYFAVQATGFAGLSLAEAIRPGSSFSCIGGK